MDYFESINAFLNPFKRQKIYQKAENLYENNAVLPVEYDLGTHVAEFVVKSQSNVNKEYSVEIKNFHDSKTLHTACTCPYEGDVCKHALASLMELLDVIYLDEDPLENENAMDVFSGFLNKMQLKPHSMSKPNTKKLVTKELIVKGNLDIEGLHKVSDIEPYVSWGQVFMPEVMVDLEELPHQLKGTFEGDQYTIHCSLEWQDKNQKLICTCNCGDRRYPLCRHAWSMLTHMTYKYECEEDLIFFLRDHSAKIDEKLREYGYTAQDEWRDKFEVIINCPDVNIIPKDPGLSKLAPYANWSKEIDHFIKPRLEIDTTQFKLPKRPKIYAILWTTHHGEIPLPGLRLVQGKQKKNGELGSTIYLITKYHPHLDELPLTYRLLVEKLSVTNPEQKLEQYPPEEQWDYKIYLTCLQDLYKHIFELYHELSDQMHYLLAKDGNPYRVSVGDILRVYPQQELAQLQFEFRKSSTHFLLKPLVLIDGQLSPLEELDVISPGIFLLEDRIYLIDPGALSTLLFFNTRHTYRIQHQDLEEFKKQFLLPLSERYPVNMLGDHVSLIPQTADIRRRLYLKEVEDYLIFTPTFEYQLSEDKVKEVMLDKGYQLVLDPDKQAQTLTIKRDTESEELTRAFFQQLHPEFSHSDLHYFAIPIDQVLSDGWFFEAFEKIQQEGFEVMGLKDLKKIRYNPYSPTVQMRASKGRDWFDLEVKVSFGDQSVKLADIRKALLNKQRYVKLGDGSVGLLPKEWLNKYSSLLKLGKVKQDKVRLSEFQLGAIDEWIEEIDHTEVLQEWIEKKNRIKEFKKINQVAVPEGIAAELRNYQKEGYNWLNFLDEFGWGGCLADDMGLGKTLQVLTFLLKISYENEGATHLVVVPTSLVFNWLQEIEKFCPGVNVLRHTGADRVKDPNTFAAYDIVITTYGLVRSDIDWLRKFSFHYVVLDESQAIKNPTTKIAKAVKLLNARNRLIMTGTPIENNTFDLYSQMDFLNRGMLGSLEVFRKEFANPIDKDRNEAVAQQLRKLVYPFILSRKKQEVAKELPEKIETVLYCEMGKEQQKVYDYFKETYKNLIIDKIATEGMNQAGMYILQGLLKLRQICNAPSLVSDEENTFTQESAKMEMLMEHLDDISAEGHKVLIFSFFTEMLNLIGAELIKRDIDYVLLTGQSQKRQELVQTFKEDETKQVFLISLKAGGFGLNLTEASYVFLVDPWWNPAVEQQAIDRTHRIGQDKQVFAYKLICKDTIEEKILQLQRDKQAVAEDIIHIESGFLKKLNPDDVKDLFS